MKSLGSVLFICFSKMTHVKPASRHANMSLYVYVSLILPAYHAFHSCLLPQNYVIYLDFVHGCG